MDRSTSIMEKQRGTRTRDKYLMKDKYDIDPVKKLKGSSGEEHVESKLHKIQSKNLPNADPDKLFATLKVADFSFFLSEESERTECPLCKKKSKIYCADC